MTRLSYAAGVVATTPFLFAGLLVGLAELALGGDGVAAEWVVRPFLRAVERGRIPLRRGGA